MATLAEIEDALRNAHAAGDTESARKLADAYTSMQENKKFDPLHSSKKVLQNPVYRIGRGALSLGEGLAQGASHLTGIKTDEVDKYINEQNTQDKAANPGIDVYNLLGQAATPLAGLKYASKAIQASTKLPSIIKAIAPAITTGFATGLTSPVINSDNYAKDKMANTNMSTVGSLALSGLAELPKSATKIVSPWLSRFSQTPLSVVYDIFSKGGKSAQQEFKKFRSNEDLVDELVVKADSLYEKVKQSGLQKYVANKKAVESDNQILPFDSIYDKIDDVISRGKFKDHVNNPNLVKTAAKIKEMVLDYESRGPEYHTPVGLDSLKREIRSIPSNRGNDVLANPDFTAIAEISKAVDSVIKKESPLYVKMTSESSDTLDFLKELRDNLSLGKKANPQNVINKLQSTFKKPHVRKIIEKFDSKDNFIPAIAGNRSSAMIPSNAGIFDLGMIGGGASLLSPAYAAAHIAGRSPYISSLGAQLAGNIANVSNRAEVPSLIKQFLLESTTGENTPYYLKNKIKEK